MKILVAGLVAAGLGVSSLAQAQPNFANLQPAGLRTVYVTDRTGQETRGTLLTITESSITIDVAGTPKTFASDDVSLIERRGDSLKNGAIAGMVVGAVGGIFSMGRATTDPTRANRRPSAVLPSSREVADAGAHHGGALDVDDARRLLKECRGDPRGCVASGRAVRRSRTRVESAIRIRRSVGE